MHSLNQDMEEFKDLKVFQELWYTLQTSFCIYLHTFFVFSLQIHIHFSSLCINTSNILLLINVFNFSEKHKNLAEQNNALCSLL